MINTLDNRSDPTARPAASELRSQRLWIYGAFALLWAIFYLATPLSVRFTASEEFNAVNNDLSDEERAEINAEETAQGNVEREVSLSALALFGIACLALPAERRLRVQNVGGIIIIGFLAWIALSVVWSGELGMTLRKLAVLGCLSVAAIGVAKRFSLRQIIGFTVFAGGLLLVAGILSELALGTFEPWDPDYRFAGLTWPAFNAWMLSLSLLAAAALYPSAGKYRKGLVVLCIPMLAAVLMARTRASTAALLVGFVIYAALAWPPRRVLIASLAGVTCISAGVLLLCLATPDANEKIVDVVNLGRAESAEGISGRSQLWEDLAPYIARRPLIGYGYDSFWTPAHLVEIGGDNWGAPDAHNTYINLTLGIGLVGAGAFVLVMLSGICRAWGEGLKTRSREYAFACGAVAISAINAGFVSTQLAPALYSFVTMAILAHLAFVYEPHEKAVSIA